MKKIGFYSGTFDPVHVGHIEFALAAAKQFGLARVVMLPEKEPRQKSETAPFDDRVAMLRLAVKQYAAILDVMVLSATQFTVAETLPLLQNAFAGDQLVYLCGSDVVKTFTYRWEGLEVLLQSVDVVVGLRNKDTKKSVDDIFASLGSGGTKKNNYTVIQSPKIMLASTVVRAGRHTITDLDPGVAEYITRKQLYISG